VLTEAPCQDEFCGVEFKSMLALLSGMSLSVALSAARVPLTVPLTRIQPLAAFLQTACGLMPKLQALLASYGNNPHQHVLCWLLLLAVRTTNLTGIPIMRPLWFEFPDQQGLFAVDEEFMLGPAMLIRPVLQVT